MKKRLGKIGALLFLGLMMTDSAQAAQPAIKVLKSNSVMVYRDPSAQSRVVFVLKQGQVVEIESQRDGWMKLKIPYGNAGYFVTGWVNERSSGYVIVNASVTTPRQMATVNRPPAIRSTARNEESNDKVEKDFKGYARGFMGPVFSLYNYGAFQYRIGVSYDLPLSEGIKLGFPISYLMGDGFSSYMFALTPMYSFYWGSIGFTMHAGAGYEHLFGNDKSFDALDGEAGITLEYSISDRFVLGVSPFTAQAMLWNSTDSLNKIPFNVRGQSMILLKGSL